MFSVECKGGSLPQDQDWGLYTDVEFETEEDAQEYIRAELVWDRENLPKDLPYSYEYRVVPLAVGE